MRWPIWELKPSPVARPLPHRPGFRRRGLERGITFTAQPIHLRKNLPAVIEDAEQNLTPRLRWLLDRLWQEWKQAEIYI